MFLIPDAGTKKISRWKRIRPTEGDETCVQCTHTKVRHTEYSPASQPAYESANSTGVQKVATPAFLLASLTATARVRSET